MRSLAEVEAFDPHSLTCATPKSEFIQIANDMKAWSDILEHKDYIVDDIKTWKSIEKILIEFRKKSEEELSCISFNHFLAEIVLVQL